jgi:hypothetical protein
MNVKIGYTLQLTAGIWWDSRLIMNTYSVTFKMLTVSTDHENQNIALDRLRYMADQCFTDTVFVYQEHRDQIARLRAAGIGVTELPEEPVDQIIGMMLFAKMNAVMEDQICVKTVLISSRVGDDVIYEHNDTEDIAPFNDEGWWLDPEPTHDVPPADIDSDSVFVMPSSKLWREVGLDWNSSERDITAENILVFAEFKNDKDK